MICGWYLDDMWMIFGWYVGDIWMICGWYLDDMWVITGWYLDDMWVISGWYLDDMWVITLNYTCNKSCKKELLFITKFKIYWHWYFRKHLLIPLKSNFSKMLFFQIFRFYFLHINSIEKNKIFENSSCPRPKRSFYLNFRNRDI